MTKKMIAAALVALVLPTASPLLPRAAAADWPRFRGPNGSGVDASANTPAKFTERELDWKIALPGVGHSSPVVVGNKVFVTCGDPQSAKRMLICVDLKDGKELWRREHASAPYKQHRDNSYASGSPAADDGRVVYTFVAPDAFKVYCVDHTGKEQWTYDMGPWKSEHGPGASPIFFEDLVIVSNDQDGATASLVALDKATGSERWRVARKSGRAAASTPCLYTPAGGGPAQLILTCSGSGMTSVDPKTGKQNWQVLPAPPSYRSVGSPVASDRWVVGSWGEGPSGPNRVVLLVNPAAPAAGGAAPQEVLKLTKTPNYPYVPSPVIRGDRMFLWSDIGAVTCLKLPGGEPLWQERIRGNAARTEFYASPVVAGDKIYNVSKDGEVFCLAAGDTFKELGRSALNDKCFASPAVAGDRLVIRTASTLVSVGGKK
jgi:outer membrane protein assembly factor BamB